MLKRPVIATTSHRVKVAKLMAEEKQHRAAVDKITGSELKAKFFIPASCTPGNRTITARDACSLVVTADLDDNIRVHARLVDGAVMSIRIAQALRETASGALAYEDCRRSATVTIISDSLVNHPSLESRYYDALLMEKDESSTDFRVVSLFDDKRYATFRLSDGSQVVYVSLPTL